MAFAAGVQGAGGARAVVHTSSAGKLCEGACRLPSRHPRREASEHHRASCNHMIRSMASNTINADAWSARWQRRQPFRIFMQMRYFPILPSTYVALRDAQSAEHHANLPSACVQTLTERFVSLVGSGLHFRIFHFTNDEIVGGMKCRIKNRINIQNDA